MSRSPRKPSLPGIAQWSLLGPVILALSGCSRALVVESQTGLHSTNRKQEPGVPFYVKTEVYRQATTYEHRWLDVKLTTADVVDHDDKKKPITGPPTVRIRHVRRSSDGLIAIRKLQDLVASFETPGDRDARLSELTKALMELDAVAVDPENPAASLSELRVIKNTIDRALVTDYKHVYFLNARSTWFSAGKVSTEMGKDGSLTKAEGEAGGGLPELLTAGAGAITGFVPVQDLLRKKWDLTTSVPRATKAVELHKEVLASLEVNERGYQYEFRREFVTAPCDSAQAYPAVDGSCAKPLLPEFASGVFVRTPLGGEPMKDAKPAYTVEGRIELPKSDDDDKEK